MADFTKPFAEDGLKQMPTQAEREQGFLCGPAKRELFNALFYRIEAELGDLIDYAGLTGDDNDLTQVRQAVLALISAATGGNPAGYILMTQATARLPIYPEVLNVDGRIVVTAPATGTVRVPGGVNFLHRGIDVITTSQTDLVTAASKTYHLRWNKTDGFALKDTTGGSAYNPASANEADAMFDSTFDDMLIARIVTNASNVATITNLANKHDLSVMVNVTGTSLTYADANYSSVLLDHTYNWARTPKNASITPLRHLRNHVNMDGDFVIFDGTLSRDQSVVAGHPGSMPTNRYRLRAGMMMDHMSGVPTVLFNARA